MQSSQQKKIAVLGVPAVDVVLQFSRFPGPGEHQSLTGLETTPGGPACNIATALARLGARVHIYGKVGRDIYGGKIIEDMEEEGIKLTDPLDPEIDTTTTVFNLVEQTAEGKEKSQRSFSRFGAGDPSEIGESIDASTGDFDLIFLDGIAAMAKRTFQGVMDLADNLAGKEGKKRPAKSSMLACNPNLRIGEELPPVIESRMAEIFSRCQLLVMNEKEAYLLSGISGADLESDSNLESDSDLEKNADLESDIEVKSKNEGEKERIAMRKAVVEKAAERLLTEYPGVQQLVITRGGKGAFLISAGERDNPVFLEASSTETVDTSGAGDIFTAALMLARLEGKSLKEAGLFAGDAAARVVSRPGAWSAIPDRQQFQQLLNTIKK